MLLHRAFLSTLAIQLVYGTSLQAVDSGLLRLRDNEVRKLGEIPQELFTCDTKQKYSEIIKQTASGVDTIFFVDGDAVFHQYILYNQFMAKLINDKDLSNVYWVILTAKQTTEDCSEHYTKEYGITPDFSFLDHPRVWSELYVRNHTNKQERDCSKAELTKINAEAVDDRLRVLSIWMSSRNQMQSIKRWILFSNDDAITMGKSSLQGKNAWERQIYTSLHDTVGKKVIPLRPKHYGGFKHDTKCSKGKLLLCSQSPNWRCNCGLGSARYDNGVLLDVVECLDYARLVDDIQNRTFDECAAQCKYGKENGIIKCSKQEKSGLSKEELNRAGKIAKKRVGMYWKLKAFTKKAKGEELLKQVNDFDQLQQVVRDNKIKSQSRLILKMLQQDEDKNNLKSLKASIKKRKDLTKKIRKEKQDELETEHKKLSAQHLKQLDLRSSESLDASCDRRVWKPLLDLHIELNGGKVGFGKAGF